MKYKELFKTKMTIEIVFTNNEVYVKNEEGKEMPTLTLLLRNYLRKRGEYPFVLSNDSKLFQIEKNNLIKIVKDWGVS